MQISLLNIILKRYTNYIFILIVLLCSCKEQSKKSGDNQTERYTCLYFISPNCPACIYLNDKVNVLADKYIKIDFIAIYSCKSNAVDTNELNDLSNLKLNFPIVIDSTEKYRKLVNAKITPEFFLLNNKNTILYQGAFDNYYFNIGKHKNKATVFYLENAIDDLMESKPIRRKYTTPFGCIIE